VFSTTKKIEPWYIHKSVFKKIILPTPNFEWWCIFKFKKYIYILKRKQV